jgi:general secretion pathway protein L
MESTRHPIAHGLRGFFVWWLGELAAMVPLRLRRMATGTSHMLVLEFGAQEVVVGCDSVGHYRELGRIDISLNEPASMRGAMAKLTRKMAGGRTVATIRLPDDKALRKSIRLPLAAEENLREVLGFEMDRHTPFQSGDVFYDYRVVERDEAAQQITVDLAVAPRAVIDGAIKAARDYGLTAVSVEIAGDDTVPDQPFNLLPPAPDDGQGSSGGRLIFGLGLLALLLGALAAYIPLDREQREAARLLDRVTVAKAEANLAAALRDEIKQTIEAGGFLVDKKRRTPAVIELLAELTRLLPDDTSLLQFQLRDSKMTIAGLSAGASDLVGIIEKSRYFREAEFRSIVAQNVEDGLERFQLSATVERGAAP